MLYDYKAEYDLKRKITVYNVYEIDGEKRKLITGFAKQESAKRYTDNLIKKRKAGRTSAFRKLEQEILPLKVPLVGPSMKIVARRTQEYVQGSLINETAIVESRYRPDVRAVSSLIGKNPDIYGIDKERVKWLSAARWQVDWQRSASAGG